MGSYNIQYPWTSSINVANFVSTKLWFQYTSSNYVAWKEQMLCLIEDQSLLGFIDGSIFPPPPPPPGTITTATTWDNDNYLVWRRSDRLLRGWILGSLTENMVAEVAVFGISRYIWVYLENKYSQLLNSLQFQNVAAAQVALSATEQKAQEKDMMEYMALYKAALGGDWETAKRIFDQDPGAIYVVLNNLRMTPLQVAVGAGKRAIRFVLKMVEMIPPTNEKLMFSAQSIYGETALHIAAAVGNIDAATILVTRAPYLLYIREFRANDFPIHFAATYAHKRMLQYLISVTNEQAPYDGMDGFKLLVRAINAEFFDVALYLVDKYPYLAKLRSPTGDSALSVVAAKHSAFTNGSISFWEHFVPYVTRVTSNSTMEKQMMKEQAQSLVKCLCDKMESMSYSEATDISNSSVMIATQLGIHQVVEMIVEALPNAIYTLMTDSNQSIFHVAILNRSEHVYNLIHQMSDHRYIYADGVDNQGNSLLHAAGKLAPSERLNKISGAALQMQREIQWYKEVEKIVNPNNKKRLNNQSKSPKMVFTEEHKNLKEEGEKWMKNTSESCTIAAALIVTIMFAAAITVPGGNENGSGFPVFSKDDMFLVFAISDAVSLFASTTSLLMFLSILTSRYAEEDFLHVLPKRLIIGLGSLFVSITFMMVAFCATVYLVFGQKKAWVLVSVAALACLPITSFVLLQFPLLMDLVSSTFGPGIFGKQSTRPFY